MRSSCFLLSFGFYRFKTYRATFSHDTKQRLTIHDHRAHRVRVAHPSDRLYSVANICLNAGKAIPLVLASSSMKAHGGRSSPKSFHSFLLLYYFFRSGSTFQSGLVFNCGTVARIRYPKKSLKRFFHKEGEKQ